MRAVKNDLEPAIEPRLRDAQEESGADRPVSVLDEHFPVVPAPPAAHQRRVWTLGLALAGAIALSAVALLLRGGFGGPDAVAPDRPTPVRAARIELGDLALYSEYPGELVGEVSDLAPKVSGLLREVRARIGDRVERGAVVAVVDDTDLRRQLEEARGQLGVAVANERRAQAELGGVESELRRSEDLHRQAVLSAQSYDLVVARAAQARANVGAARAQIDQSQARVKLLEQQLGDTRVVAPFTGTVATRYLDPGALVHPGTPILRLVEDGRLLVQFRVPERDLGAVRVGVALSLTTQATGKSSFPGRVQRISGEVSRADRTALVEGTPDGPAGVLRPGMYAQVRVEVREILGAPLVPGVAVLRRVGADGVERTGVFTVGEGGVAEWHDVAVLGAAGGRIALETDLAAGDPVLTLGHEELRPGSPVEVMQWEGDGSAAADLGVRAGDLGLRTVGNAPAGAGGPTPARGGGHAAGGAAP